MTLDRLRPGKSALIKRVGGHGELNARLIDMGLIPGTVITLEKKAPFGDPLEFRLRGYELSLRAADARLVTVEEMT